jgi:2-polyprenyl-3-methyl-5-hydroxy-6-metoxy-1,4-benzoquinol methylase
MNPAIDKETVGRKIAEHYESVWQSGDAWGLESSEFEQRRFDFQIQLLSDRRYGAVLEIGCGSGCLSRRLAEISDRVVPVDISASAIERARVQAAGAGASNIEFRVANVMDFDVAAEGPWDLVVLSETTYSLGWLYSMFDVGFLIARLHDAIRPGGVLLLANTYGETRDWLLRPWLIDTYRDLVRNVGFQLDREEIYSGIKDSVEFEVLMSVFHRVDEASVLDT